MDAWHLNTVDEEDEEDRDDGMTHPAEPDMTFLTGVGIEEARVRGARRPPPEPSDEVVEEATAAPDRPAWEDVEDPTERLALALGLDPLQLAIHTGKMTMDR